MTGPVRRVGVVIFDGFELLDVFGPLEVLGVGGSFAIELVGPAAGPVPSAQGPRAVADAGWTDAAVPDLVLVPGGAGTRALARDDDFLAWLAPWAAGAAVVASVCTGAALLAAAGLLDGYRATSNKRSFAWVAEQGPRVTWVGEARWVHDGTRWTSSGVAAGIDMTLALLAELRGEEVAVATARRIEHHWQRDAALDAFAGLYGLSDPPAQPPAGA